MPTPTPKRGRIILLAPCEIEGASLLAFTHGVEVIRMYRGHYCNIKPLSMDDVEQWYPRNYSRPMLWRIEGGGRCIDNARPFLLDEENRSAWYIIGLFHTTTWERGYLNAKCEVLRIKQRSLRTLLWMGDASEPEYVVTAAMCDIQPDRMITTEYNAEPFVRWMDRHLKWYQQCFGVLPLFSAIYGAGQMRVLAPRMRAAQQFVLGEKTRWIDSRMLAASVSQSYISQVAIWRHADRRYFYADEKGRQPRLNAEIRKLNADWQWGARCV